MRSVINQNIIKSDFIENIAKKCGTDNETVVTALGALLVVLSGHLSEPLYRRIHSAIPNSTEITYDYRTRNKDLHKMVFDPPKSLMGGKYLALNQLVFLFTDAGLINGEMRTFIKLVFNYLSRVSAHNIQKKVILEIPGLLNLMDNPFF